VIVSQYDIYVKDAVLDALSPPNRQFVIRLLFVEWLRNNAENYAFFEATQRIVIGSQIGEWEVKEHLKLHLVCIYHIDTITTQILNWRQDSQFAKIWNQPKNCRFGAAQFFDEVKLVASVPVRFQPGPGTEPPICNHS
jgi:hypothetical protein